MLLFSGIIVGFSMKEVAIMGNTEKRLYKSESNKVISGVCGGLGEYFGIDPVIFRIIAVLLIFAHGAGLLIYLIAWLCMPKRRHESAQG